MPVVVMFYAGWCGKCSMMKPIVESVEKKFRGRIKFCKIDIDECASLAKEYGMSIVPAFVMFKNGEIESLMQGILDEEVFEERVADLLR